jgi:LPPG:FO 2-phospho-L-lactate transferase
VLDAIAEADVVVIAPSNPIVSIGPLLAVPGVRDAVAARRDAAVAVSPIVAGAALKGPADRMLTELGHEASVVGVARLYRDWPRPSWSTRPTPVRWGRRGRGDGAVWCARRS